MTVFGILHGARSQAAPFIALLAAILAFITPPSPVDAASIHDPGLTWQTLHTPHFAIHFHDGEQDLATRVARIAEQGHADLTTRLNWRPRERTDIILTDRFDFSNGWATPFPGNTLTMLTIPPEDVFGLEDYDDWLELLFIHEYTHILHMDKAAGAPGVLRGIFGRIWLLFPNIFQPSWLLEGLATHVETDPERGIGRGQSSLFRAMMRLEWQNGLKPIAQVNISTEEWPVGAIPYLYGVYFYQFLADTYGEDGIRRLTDRYSGNIIPFMINTNSRSVLGKDMAALWRDFDAWLGTRFAAEAAALGGDGWREGEPLTRSGYYTGSPRVMENRDVYYIEDSRTRRPRLMRLAGDRAEVVAEVRGHRFDAHPRAGILLVQNELLRNTNYFNDLYRIDPRTGRETRMTEGRRYREAIWTPDGAHIIAVQYALGRHALQRLDARGHHQETLWQADDDTVIGSLAIAPDGNTLAAAVWRPATHWNLELFDLQQRTWTALTHSREIEAQPAFSRDGSHLLFSADYGGVYNIHRLALADGAIDRLTHVPGAALQPAISADGMTLYYAHLGPGGYDLHRTQIDALPATAGTPRPEKTIVPEPASPATRTTAYSPVRGLLPKWWFPYWVYMEDRNEIGAATSGNDPLWRHFYQIQLGYDVENNWPAGYLSYRYDRWQPSLQLYAAREKIFELYSNNELERVRDSDTIIVAVERPFLKYERQWALHAGLVHERERDARLGTGAVALPEYENSLAGLALSYNDSDRYPDSISPNDGRRINLVWEDSDVMGGHYRGITRRIDWREYLRTGAKQLLALRAAAGEADTEAEPFRLGGIIDDPIALPGNPASPPPFNRREFPLRGYPEGLAALRGHNMNLVELEWRFPLRRIDRTWMAPPLGVQQVHGKAFFNRGGAWTAGSKPDEWRDGAGVELSADIVAGYLFGLTLRLGYAHGFDTGGEDQLYLALGSSF